MKSTPLVRKCKQGIKEKSTRRELLKNRVSLLCGVCIFMYRVDSHELGY